MILLHLKLRLKDEDTIQEASNRLYVPPRLDTYLALKHGAQERPSARYRNAKHLNRTSSLLFSSMCCISYLKWLNIVWNKKREILSSLMVSRASWYSCCLQPSPGSSSIPLVRTLFQAVWTLPQLCVTTAVLPYWILGERSITSIFAFAFVYGVLISKSILEKIKIKKYFKKFAVEYFFHFFKSL